MGCPYRALASFVVNAASFLFSAACIARLALPGRGFRPPRASHVDGGGIRPWHEYKEGLRYMRSVPLILGLLAERQLGRIRLFINGENLTGVRQTRWDPLLRPTRAPDGRWTVDAWAPLEGRNINGGLRVRF